MHRKETHRAFAFSFDGWMDISNCLAGAHVQKSPLKSNQLQTLATPCAQPPFADAP